MLTIYFFIAGFVLRLYSISQSLWLDEGTTAQVVRKFGFVEIITQFSPTDFHPPLYYLFMRFWTLVFGYSELSLRMPSVIFTMIAAYFVCRIAKYMGVKNAPWAVGFFLFNPLIMYYSQEARMYAVATCLLSAVFYYYISYESNRTRSTYFLLDLLIALSIFTFYGSVFFIAALCIHSIWFKKYSRLSTLLPAAIGALFILSPLLFKQYDNAKSMLSLVPNWSQVLGSVGFKNILLFPLKFSIGRIQWEPKLYYYAVAGLWSLFVTVTAVIGAKRQKNAAIIFVVPILLGIIFSYVTPLLQYFRFVYLIPMMSLLLAAGISFRYQKWALLAGFILFSFLYIVNPTFHREDWRSVAAAVPENSEVYMVFSASDPLQYYLYRQNTKGVRIFDLSHIEGMAGRAGRITVIPYVSDIHGVEYEPPLKKAGYSRVGLSTFRGVVVERWEKIIYANRAAEAFYIR